MKHLITLIALVAVVGFASFVEARGVSRGGKGGKTGLEGTVESVGSQGFTLSTTDGKTLKILCNANTIFKSGSNAATAADIKQGVKVTVQGGLLTADEVMANSVTIMGQGGSKKKK